MAGTTAFGIPYPQLADLMKITANMQALAEKVQDLLDRPFCKLILPSNFGIANNTNAPTVPFGAGSEAYKTHASMHSTVTNNTRVIAPKKGVYLVTAAASFAPSTNGFRTASIGKNGARQATEVGIYNSAALPVGANVTLPHIALEITLDVGDYVELFMFQNSGGPLNAVGDGTLTNTGNTQLSVMMQRPIV